MPHLSARMDLHPASARDGRRPLRVVRAFWLLLLVFAAGLPLRAAWADTLDQARELLDKGEYQSLIRVCKAEVESGNATANWLRLLLQAQMARGEYDEALRTYRQAIDRYSWDISLMWEGVAVLRMNNQPEAADAVLRQIEARVRQSPWRYRDRESQLVVGRLLLRRNADPKAILDQLLRPLQGEQPQWGAVPLLIGEIALSKQDFALAAEAFEEAKRRWPTDPRAELGLAEAYIATQPERAEAALEAALQKNPRHVDSLLFAVDRHVAGESYDQAEKVLEQIEQVNPRDPRLWAFRAVLAHLDNRTEDEERLRQRALEPLEKNPVVDHLIGEQLSRKYRFAEGAEYQRRALRSDPSYLPAKIQLSQDLLRLGQEEEGWRLAEEVHREDQYQIVPYNLLELHDRIQQFTTLEEDGIQLRMDPIEARIYGPAAMELLQRARKTLAEKYAMPLTETVLVEIFPHQADFAIRTFGLPGGQGFLGVCFGNVITAPSPRADALASANWQSTLWHEFCHVVTLNKTHNKMPRWLSEGISVYEERQADSSWGQRMTPRYREMILGSDFIPLSRLSEAFLSPKTPEHLQFAYYESSLAVDFLVDRHGWDVLLALLDDLGEGTPIDQALERQAGPVEDLDEDFRKYARARAEQFGAQADWERMEAEETDEATLRRWLEEHPDSFWALQGLANQAMAQQDWPAAEKLLERLIQVCPEDQSAGNARMLLAKVYVETGRAEQAIPLWQEVTRRTDQALEADRALLELAAGRGDAEGIRRHAHRLLAVNPFQAGVHESLGELAREQGETLEWIRRLDAQLALDPPDPAQLHFQLAQALQPVDPTQAKRHVLLALERAPRFQEAHRLLLELVDPPEPAPASGVQTQEGAAPSAADPVGAKPDEDDPHGEQAGDAQPADASPSEEQPSEEQPSEEQPSEEQPDSEQPGEESSDDKQPGDKQPGEDGRNDALPGQEDPGTTEPSVVDPAATGPGEKPGAPAPDATPPGPVPEDASAVEEPKADRREASSGPSGTEASGSRSLRDALPSSEEKETR